MTNIELMQLRNSYHQLTLTNSFGEEELWIKKLRFILESDIHKKPLGCKISDTHIKIGTVHLDAFYEAQILFSLVYWVNKFASWICQQLDNTNGKLLLIGYETYIEPVLSIVKSRIKSNKRKASVDYCIFEEPKYIQRDEKSEIKLRNEELLTKRFDQVIYICGISSTLSTFTEMEKYVNKMLKNNHNEISKRRYLSIIQVLPEEFHCTSKEKHFYLSDDTVLIKNDAKTISKESRRATLLTVTFLVDVFCNWSRAEECVKCFPDDALTERPIIATDITSIVPLQMISRDKYDEDKPIASGNNTTKLDFFEIEYKKEKNEKEKDADKERKASQFKYEQFLYYNHIDRDDNHYRYYLRTRALFQEIIEKRHKKFQSFCSDVHEILFAQNKVTANTIDIIIAPAHYSNELFPIAINHEVFNDSAHIISFDIKKEYRSNFETKFSNIAYFIDQTNGQPAKIRFFFVDDGLVSGDTFYRAKSLVNSLMQKREQNQSCQVEIFSAVILLTNRNSDSTKKNFVENPQEQYFSFIDIDVPSIRNYGDSCPICKLKADAEHYARNSALVGCEYYWTKKTHHHRVRTLIEAKKENVNKERYFRRFYCENEMWKALRNCCSEMDFLVCMLDRIYLAQNMDLDEHAHCKGVSCDNLISFIKAISLPFLYYKENEKKAALRIIISLIENLIHGQADAVKRLSVEGYGEKIINIRFNQNNIGKEYYDLIVILINALASIDSNYLLNIERIITLCDFVESIDIKYLLFDEIGSNGSNQFRGLYTVIVSAIKRIICGISGDAKCRFLEKSFVEFYKKSPREFSKYKLLLETVYLEILEKSNNELWENDLDPVSKKERDGINERDKTGQVISKYDEISKHYKRISGKPLKLFGENDEIQIKLKDVKFYYADLKRKNECLFTLDENVSYTNLTDLFDTNDINEMQDGLTKIGFYGNESSTKYVISLSNFSTQDIKQEFDVKNNIQNLPEVYLCIDFEEKCDYEERLHRLKYIRETFLVDRRVLSEMISKDMKTGAIKSAIQAKKSAYIFSTDKVQSHGKSQDMYDLYIFVLNALTKCETLQDREKVYDGIKVLMNRTISYVVTKRWHEIYFKPQGDGAKDTKTYLKPLDTRVQNFTDEKAIQFIFSTVTKYIQDICVKESAYLQKIYTSCRKESGISGLPEIKPIEVSVSGLENLNVSYLPMLLEGQSNAAENVIWLIGFLDIFIRNSIKHCLGASSINIRLEFEENKTASKESYKFTVINPLLEEPNDGGMTKEFCNILKENQKRTASYSAQNSNSLLPVSTPKERSGYAIDMRGYKENDKYKSCIEVIKII